MIRTKQHEGLYVTVCENTIQSGTNVLFDEYCRTKTAKLFEIYNSNITEFLQHYFYFIGIAVYGNFVISC